MNHFLTELFLWTISESDCFLSAVRELLCNMGGNRMREDADESAAIDFQLYIPALSGSSGARSEINDHFHTTGYKHVSFRTHKTTENAVQIHSKWAIEKL